MELQKLLDTHSQLELLGAIICHPNTTVAVHPWSNRSRQVDTTRFVSFLEFDYRAGAVGLGAGSPESVLHRDHSLPFMRVCCLEPPEEAVRFRAQLGSANVIAAGLRWVEQRDPMLHRGAWIRMIPLCRSLSPAFKCYASKLLVDMVPRKRRTPWLGYDSNRSGYPLRPITEIEASAMLDAASGLEGATAIRIVGSRASLRYGPQDRTLFLGKSRCCWGQDRTLGFRLVLREQEISHWGGFLDKTLFSVHSRPSVTAYQRVSAPSPACESVRPAFRRCG